MKCKTLALGSYQTNCYILWEGDKCLVIDPGYEAQRVLLEIKALGKELEAILLTHGHFDHVGAVRELAEATGCKVYICPEELSLPTQLTAGPLYYTDTYGEGTLLELAGLTLRVLHTPGHTPGCVCLLCQDHMFSGDTLFAGSCGRTDLPGGSWSQIQASLRRLAGLETDYTVCPGHGPSSTLFEEKRFNPYMQ